MNEAPIARVAHGVRSNLSSLSLMIADSTQAEIALCVETVDATNEWCARVAAAL